MSAMMSLVFLASLLAQAGQDNRGTDYMVNRLK